MLGRSERAAIRPRSRIRRTRHSKRAAENCPDEGWFEVETYILVERRNPGWRGRLQGLTSRRPGADRSLESSRAVRCGAPRAPHPRKSPGARPRPCARPSPSRPRTGCAAARSRCGCLSTPCIRSAGPEPVVVERAEGLLGAPDLRDDELALAFRRDMEDRAGGRVGVEIERGDRPRRTSPGSGSGYARDHCDGHAARSPFESALDRAITRSRVSIEGWCTANPEQRVNGLPATAARARRARARSRARRTAAGRRAPRPRRRA